MVKWEALITLLIIAVFIAGLIIGRLDGLTAGRKSANTHTPSWEDRQTMPSFPAICGATFTNNTGNHGGSDHQCSLAYHATGMHQCRFCGAQGD